MTYLLEALKDLKAKVEAGEEVSARDASRLWPNGYAHAVNAGHGSLDAAMVLHNAVLPDWVVHRIGQRHGGVWEVIIMQVGDDGWHEADKGHKRISVFNDNPARALLISDLKALIAQEQAND